MKPKVLMIGWEFPPLNSGGLGVATKGMAMGLGRSGLAEVTFVVPNFIGKEIGEDVRRELTFELVSREGGEVTEEKEEICEKYFSGYAGVSEVSREGVKVGWRRICEEGGGGRGIYGGGLFGQIVRYKAELEELVRERKFDLIHAHDWLTAVAAVHVKEKFGLPLVLQIHATEMDRTGGNPNKEIYEIEKWATEKADRVVAVSNYTKSVLVRYYGVPAEKITVVHNGLDKPVVAEHKLKRFEHDKKTVLFLGRVTIQKGPDWFLRVAKRVLEVRDDVQFLVAGKGDMLPGVLKEVAREGLGKRVFCVGFLKREEVEEAFNMADVFVMPSVSEPFGLVAVESVQKGTPVVLSKQSGVREVLRNSFQADFWDVDKMADQILALLEYKPLGRMMARKATEEVADLTWERQAGLFREVYGGVLAG